MPLYGGIALHATNRVVVLLHAQDQVIYQRRFANPLPTILEPFAPYQAALKGVVVASTSTWSWLGDGWREAGYRDLSPTQPRCNTKPGASIPLTVPPRTGWPLF